MGPSCGARGDRVRSADTSRADADETCVVAPVTATNRESVFRSRARARMTRVTIIDT